LLMALGMTPSEMLTTYYSTINYELKKKSWVVDFQPETLTIYRLNYDLVNAETNEIVLEAGQKITPRLAKKFAEAGLKKVIIPNDTLLGAYLGSDLVDKSSGEVLAKIGMQITEDMLAAIDTAGIKSLSVLKVPAQGDAYIRNTLFADRNQDQNASLIDIFRVLRPGEPATVEAGSVLFNNLFFDPDRYDLSEVGRIKMNARLNLNVAEGNTCLTKEDIKTIVQVLVDLKDGKGAVDDIDHLGNRRVRSVGELIENQFRIGLVRMERAILERMSVVDIDAVMPHDLVNSKVLVSVVKEFFSTSQLSQFMDQTNPLSEITHKRRLSALGPGGVSRDRVGFEVRDVHPTHYGRICPIETPEGQNIGLINSMATYARINKHGFIESPYRRL